jgi:protein-disulfide isomerase
MLGASFILAAASSAALATQALAPEQVGGVSRQQIEQIVHDYILEHPEILPQAMERLSVKRAAEAIGTNRSALETPRGNAWEGAKDGDVVLVEFYDYACGYCRAALPDIARLLAEDKGLKVVYHELPILSDLSADAAKVSLLVAEKGNFPAYHKALYGSQLSRERILAAAQAAGVDRKAAQAVLDGKGYEAEIAGNISLAQKLKATGTPTFVIGNQVLNGAVGYEALKAAIAEARRK